MQSWGRAAASLWSACSSAGTLAARSFSKAAAEGGVPLSKAAEAEGAKAKLFSILGAAAEPLTAAQVWEAAQPLGFKSKRFTKQMLQQMRAGGWVKTKPLQGAAAGSGKRKSGFGYQVVQAKQQRRAAQPAAAGGGGAAA